MNGNDFMNEGVWIWPIDGRNITPGSSDVYTNWGNGNLPLSYSSNLYSLCRTGISRFL